MNKEKRKESFRKLDELVKAKDISFYALSRELGLAPTVFSDWKSGRSMPKIDKLLKIAGYFDVSITIFIEV